MFKALLLLLCALTLTGCASDRRPLTPPTPPPPPPAEATAACAPLPPMFATAGQAVAWVDQVAALYVACDARRRLAIEAWPR